MKSIPPALAERMRSMLGDEYNEYMGRVDSQPRSCLRVNTLKSLTGPVLEAVTELGLSLESVPWCPTGYWITASGGERAPSDHGLGNSVEHFQGLFYLQDAASLLPAETLHPTAGDVTMDAAAAPGGKTTHLASLMGNRGALVANEVNSRRSRVLRFNLNRMGVTNAALAALDMTRLPDTGSIFDKVLLDAPCSCEGRIGEDPEALALWRPSRVKRCSRIQKRLLETCFSLLRPGGALVYSTCTFSPEENEGVVDCLLGKHNDAEVEGVAEWDGRRAKGITEWLGMKYDERVARCVRIYPHYYGTQGFFVAKVRKCL